MDAGDENWPLSKLFSSYRAYLKYMHLSLINISLEYHYHFKQSATVDLPSYEVDVSLAHFFISFQIILGKLIDHLVSFSYIIIKFEPIQ